MRSKKTTIIVSSLATVIAIGAVVGTITLLNVNQKPEQEATLNDTDANNSSQQDNTFAISSMLNSNFDASSSREMFDRSDYVALVRIDSIDGTDNYAEVINQPVRVFTYGKLTVLDNYKGDLGKNTVKNFYRVGGTISFEKYCQQISEAECSKLKTLNTEEKDISYAIAGDIDIEQGKTYLAYLKKDEALRAVEGYTFQENQGGLREIQNATTYSTTSGLKVLNNFTGEWENLSDVVKQ